MNINHELHTIIYSFLKLYIYIRIYKKHFDQFHKVHHNFIQLYQIFIIRLYMKIQKVILRVKTGIKNKKLKITVKIFLDTVFTNFLNYSTTKKNEASNLLLISFNSISKRFAKF